MVSFSVLAAAASSLLLSAARAQDADGKYTISAEGIRAKFIPYGASISNLFINDTNGVERDIVLGFDNASYYSVDKLHPHLGGVPGTFSAAGFFFINFVSSHSAWRAGVADTIQDATRTASRTAPS